LQSLTDADCNPTNPDSAVDFAGRAAMTETFNAVQMRPARPASRPLLGSEDRRLYANGLLAELPDADLALLALDLVAVTLAPGSVLQRSGEPIAYAYFIERGLVSLFTMLEDGSQLETCSIGRKGAIGLNGGLGARLATSHAIVQMPVSASRISIPHLAALAAGSSAVRDMIVRHGESLLLRTQVTLVCNTRHAGDQRLCRWLLQACEESGSTQLSVTQAALGTILGLRRTTVTLFCKALQQAGIIKVRRGTIKVSDLAALEAKACTCHRAAMPRP
jgi:CRP-like cAMP-binding protein